MTGPDPVADPLRFDPDTVAGLPEPARRFLLHVLPAGVPLANRVELEATGTIRLGSAWWPFRSTQTLTAGEGLVWSARVRRGPMVVKGADSYRDGAGTMDFRLFGLVPVARASGPDVDRSAAGRLAAETLVWLPQAATPQAGATWSPVDEQRATVTLATPAGPIEVTPTVDDEGRVVAVAMRRWSDAATPPAERPFGGSITTEHVTAEGVRIAGEGGIGWGWGTDEWDEGEFFRFRITRAGHHTDPPPD